MIKQLAVITILNEVLHPMKAISSIVLLLFAILLAACGGPQAATTNGTSGETFSIEISGDSTSSLSPEAATARFSEEEYDDDVNAYVLWFGASDEVAVSVTFYDTEPPQPGIYNISNDLQPGTVSGLVVSRSDGDLVTFVASAGTITLESAGESYGGNFEFTGQGGPIGALDQEVSVTGTFSSVQ